MYAVQKGFYSGEIAQTYWDSLNVKINKIDLNKLDSVYHKTYDDQEVEFVIYKDGKRKYVLGQTDSLPLPILPGSKISPIKHVVFVTKEKIKKTPEKAPKIMRDHFIGCKNLFSIIV